MSWWIIYIIVFLFLVGLAYLVYYFYTRRQGFDKGIKEIKEAIQEIENIDKKENEFQNLKYKFEEEKRKLEDKLK